MDTFERLRKAIVEKNAQEMRDAVTWESQTAKRRAAELERAEREFWYGETDKIAAKLEGRKVVDAVIEDEFTGRLTLDDGTRLRVKGNEGCGGCSNGGYFLESLNRVDNIITRVEFDYYPTGYHEDCYAPGDGYYRVFVLAGDERINLLSVEGTDGNGYYGTGFEIIVESE